MDITNYYGDSFPLIFFLIVNILYGKKNQNFRALWMFSFSCSMRTDL